MRLHLELMSRGGPLRRKAAVWVLAGVTLIAGPASAIVPAELLTPELEWQSISFSRLDGGQLSYFDIQRRLTVGAAGDFVRLSLNPDANATPSEFDATPSPPEVAASSSMIVELIDGQRIAGRWSGAAQDGEAIVWTHPTLGRFTLGLDEVRRVTRRRAAPGDALDISADPATAEGDTLVMNNGDRLVGFIIAVEEASVTIQPDGAGDGVTLPIKNVAQLTLANPASSATVAGDLITLVDGSRVRGTGVKIAGDTATFTPTLANAMRPVDRPLGELRSLDFAASGFRLIELAGAPMTFESGTAFGLPVRPQVRRGGLNVYAPVTLRFSLPAGVKRFAARVALNLPEGLPADRAGWASVGLSVGLDDPDVPTTQRWIFTQDQPAAAINLPLPPSSSEENPGRALILKVDPAANGAVLDRLRITEAVLLVDQPAVQPGTDDPDR